MKQLNGFSQSHTEIYSWWYRDEKEADNKPLFGTDEQRVSLEEMDEPIDMEKDLEKFELRDAVSNVLSTLTSREQLVVKKVIFEGYTLGEAGRILPNFSDSPYTPKYGVCANRAGQILAKALRRLKHPKRASILREFV